MKKIKNQWAFFGSLILMLIPIGHFVIADLSIFVLEADYIRWVPASQLEKMKTTVIDFGWLGKNKVLHIFSGFSLWLAFSLFVIGLYNLLIFIHLPHGHMLRRQSLIVCTLVSFILLVLSIVCFIYPPIVGSSIALLSFVLAVIKEGKMENIDGK
jgi:hypothetical protein